MVVWQAALLVVDDSLLKLIAVEALGQRQQEGRGAGLVAWLLSFWLSGKRPSCLSLPLPPDL